MSGYPVPVGLIPGPAPAFLSLMLAKKSSVGELGSLVAKFDNTCRAVMDVTVGVGSPLENIFSDLTLSNSTTWFLTLMTGMWV